jgi:hypothetical protein
VKRENAPRQIFWDWDGVLGTQKFWHRTTQHDDHLRQFSETIFRDKALTQKWMRGQTTLADIVDEQRFAMTAETLAEILRRDWQDDAAINQRRFVKIAGQHPTAEHYIATDNMDIFSAFAGGNDFIQQNFVKVYNSAECGVLKDDQPGLFGYILGDLKLEDFSDALLLDDSPTSCERFRKLGGQAILVGLK